MQGQLTSSSNVILGRALVFARKLFSVDLRFAGLLQRSKMLIAFRLLIDPLRQERYVNEVLQGTSRPAGAQRC